MSNKTFMQIALMGATIMATGEKSLFDIGRGRVVEQKESSEDRARRERCEQITIEKAKAKRERKAAKLRFNARKED